MPENRYLFIFRTHDGMYWRKVAKAVFDSARPPGSRLHIYSIDVPSGPAYRYNIKCPPDWETRDVENILKTQIHPTGSEGPAWDV